MHTDYSYRGESLFYKHEVSRNLPKDAYSMHSHNMYELLYFVSGDATHVIEDRKYKLKKGDLVLIKPSKYHFIQIDSSCDYERYDILFSPRNKNIDGLDLLDTTPEIINLEEYPMATEIIRKTDFYRKHFDGEDFERILTGLLCELFYLLSVTPATENTDEPTVTSPTLSLALSYINDKITSLTSVEEVAKSCFVTESYLYRLFMQHEGCSPMEYLTSLRLSHAAEQLRQTALSISEIAAAVGFFDASHFSKKFTKKYGITPGEYRKQRLG